MNAYLIAPLFAAITCATFASVILVMGARQLPNRLAAGLLFGVEWWALCEVLWNTAADADTAAWLHRAAAPGWVFVAPLAIHMTCSVTESPRLRRWVPAFYAVGGCFLLLALFTPWMVAGMERTSWGYGLRPGPVFPAWAVFTGLGSGLAVAIWVHNRPDRGAGERRRGAPWYELVLAITVPIGMTDAVLPLFGVQMPRVATLCLSAVGAYLVWSLNRFGYSRLSPTAFSGRILRTLPDGVVLATPSGRVRIANHRMAELLGCRLGQTEGLDIRDHLDTSYFLPPREVREVETELTPLAGPRVPVSISTTPLVDNAGGVMGVVIIVRDTREVVTLRDRLVTTGRMVAVGQLAAGIAHEINNPLAYVRANMGHLQREWERLDEALAKADAHEVVRAMAAEWEELIEETLEGVDRAATIVRDIKSFSHAGRGERERTDLNELIEQVLRVAAPNLAAGVRVETSYGRIPPVPCAPHRLQQLFLNLIVNAAQAVDGAGVIRITTQRSADTVIATVEDDGCGISPDVVERIFDPFFTTKRVGDGSGLGLSISHQIVRSHSGEIWVDSTPGQGSAFHVRLPVH